MTMLTHPLSKRESQIMQVLYALGPSTASEVRARLPDAPGNSTVRKLLEILEKKGHVEHEVDGRRFVYRPTVSVGRAGREALMQVFQTFFRKSPERVVEALLDQPDLELTERSLRQIEAMIERARLEGR